MTDPRIDLVERTCRKLTAEDEPITFAAVAERSEVSRCTLYRDPGLRAVVEEHRNLSQEATALSALATELANQSAALEGLAKRLRRQEETIRRLTRAS